MVIFRKPVVGLTEIAVARFVARTGRLLRLKGMVDVLVTSSGELQSLNRRFLKKDSPTDVLSFPCAPGAQRLTGELAISAEIARENARQLGHSSVQEIKVLILHGMLHLAGYDHDHKDDGGKMLRKENRLRTLLNLPLGLITRSRQSPAAKPLRPSSLRTKNSKTERESHLHKKARVSKRKPRGGGK